MWAEQANVARLSPTRQRQAFSQALALLRLNSAWEMALVINSRSYWLALAGKAMEQLELDIAQRVYRQLGDAGMVMALEKVRAAEDKNLLAGHVALLFCDYAQAQELFLASSRPVTALEMRTDLMHWEQALKLARTLAPDRVPALSISYAQQLEFRAEHDPALRMCAHPAPAGRPISLSECAGLINRSISPSLPCLS
jgi:WD repeat-containing protein 19